MARGVVAITRQGAACVTSSSRDAVTQRRHQTRSKREALLPLPVAVVRCRSLLTLESGHPLSGSKGRGRAAASGELSCHVHRKKPSNGPARFGQRPNPGSAREETRFPVPPPTCTTTRFLRAKQPTFRRSPVVHLVLFLQTCCSFSSALFPKCPFQNTCPRIHGIQNCTKKTCSYLLSS